jgi:hypothetical protein
MALVVSSLCTLCFIDDHLNQLLNQVRASADVVLDVLLMVFNLVERT